MHGEGTYLISNPFVVVSHGHLKVDPSIDFRHSSPKTTAIDLEQQNKTSSIHGIVCVHSPCALHKVIYAAYQLPHICRLTAVVSHLSTFNSLTAI